MWLFVGINVNPCYWKGPSVDFPHDAQNRHHIRSETFCFYISGCENIRLKRRCELVCFHLGAGVYATALLSRHLQSKFKIRSGWWSIIYLEKVFCIGTEDIKLLKWYTWYIWRLSKAINVVPEFQETVAGLHISKATGSMALLLSLS